MLKTPSWGDVNVPSSLVNSIKAATLYSQSSLMDSLIHQFIFRNRRRPSYHYTCSACQYHWRSERSTEEVGSCPSCPSNVITSVVVLRFGKEVPAYTKRASFDDVLNQLKQNYLYYFGTIPEPFADVGWQRNFPYGEVYSQFVGGERISEGSVRMCLAKAAILNPFLWDRSFDWSQDRGVDKMNVDHISPILAYFAR